MYVCMHACMHVLKPVRSNPKRRELEVVVNYHVKICILTTFRLKNTNTLLKKAKHCSIIHARKNKKTKKSDIG